MSPSSLSPDLGDSPADEAAILRRHDELARPPFLPVACVSNHDAIASCIAKNGPEAVELRIPSRESWVRVRVAATPAGRS